MDPVAGNELSARHAELEGQYLQLKEAAETQVVTWRWSYHESGWSDPRPLACERHGTVKGPLNLEGSRSRDHDHVGLDGEGRPVFIQEHHAEGEINRHYFLIWGDERIESAEFAPPGRQDGKDRGATLHNLIVVDLDDEGKPTGGAAVYRRSVRPETYAYDSSGVLIRVEIPWEPFPDAGLDRATLQVLIPSYGEDGSLVALDQEWEDPLPHGRVWERSSETDVEMALSPRTEAWSLSDEAKRRLKRLVAREMGRVISCLARYEFQGPVCAVAMLYGDGEPELPMVTYLYALSEARRESAVREGGSVWPNLLWSPPEWDHTDLLDPSIDSGVQLAQRVGADLGDTGCEWPEEVIVREVAYQLARENLAGRVPATPDFVAWAGSTYFDDNGPEALIRAAPEAMIELYRAKGWLSDSPR